MKSAPPAPARPPLWSRSTSPIMTRSIAWAARSSSAGAGSTFLSATPACWGPLSPLPHIGPKTFADVFAVNVTANWRLIRSLDPLLRASPAARVAFLTSGVASRAETRAYWGLYAASKAALDMLARTYAAETATTEVKVMLVNPGAMRTRMRATAMPGEDPETLPTPEALTPKLMEILAPSWTTSGKLYDFPTDRVLSFRDPA